VRVGITAFLLRLDGNSQAASGGHERWLPPVDGLVGDLGPDDRAAQPDGHSGHVQLRRVAHGRLGNIDGGVAEESSEVGCDGCTSVIALKHEWPNLVVDVNSKQRDRLHAVGERRVAVPDGDVLQLVSERVAPEGTFSETDGCSKENRIEGAQRAREDVSRARRICSHHNSNALISDLRKHSLGGCSIVIKYS